MGTNIVVLPVPQKCHKGMTPLAVHIQLRLAGSEIYEAAIVSHCSLHSSQVQMEVPWTLKFAALCPHLLKCWTHNSDQLVSNI